MKRLALLAAFLAAAPIPVAVAAQQPPPAARYEHALSPQAISAVQQRLREQGFYHGPIDGVWGRGTQAALARFQESRLLEVTAQLNPATAKALDLRPDEVLGNVVNLRQPYRDNRAPPPAAQSLSVDSVAAVQHRLRDAGYYDGPRDGIWGPRTAAAVERFQRDRGLQVSGELTPSTISALGLDPNNLAASPYRSAYRGRW